MSSEAPIRVLLADDDDVVRLALEDLVRLHPQMELAGSSRDADEAIALARRVRPDVVLLDVRMPGGGGPRAAAEISALDDPPRIVAFSAHDEASAISSMLDAGASGYLVKGASNADIVKVLVAGSRRGAA